MKKVFLSLSLITLAGCNTNTIPVANPFTTALSDEELCYQATSRDGKIVRWSSSLGFKWHVKEAKLIAMISLIYLSWLRQCLAKYG